MINYNWEPPHGYPAIVHSDPLINNYVLALNPQWNTVLSPQVSLARQGVSIVDWVKSKGNYSEVRNMASKYFKTNPLPYSNPVDPTIDYSLAVQRSQERARSYQVPFVFPENPIIKKARIRLENIETARLVEKQRLDDIEISRLVEKQRLIDIQNKEKEMFNILNLERIEREKQMQNQIITFNEQQNSGDYNETPITEINPMDSCSGCGVDIHALNREQQEKEKIMKIGGIAAVGVGILLLYTRRNKK